MYDPAIKCSRINRSLPYNGSNYTEIMESVSTITNKISTIVAEGNVNSPTFRHHVPLLGEVDVDNYAIGVDYGRYRVIWQSNNHGNTHLSTEGTWILTRERVQYQDLERFIDQSFRNWRLQKPAFSTPDANCPF
ncbi:uncharacterized protein LOC123263616 isoform X2 [Cotesia glomerata]|nr:uncharacterized protein LOC123263616 isoform X2 [Cotesia glomerata]